MVVLVGATVLVGTSSAVHAAPGPVTGAFLDGEVGTLMSGQQMSFDTVTAGLRFTGSTTLTFHVTSGANSFDMWFAPVAGQAWAPGNYENAERADFRSAGHPGLDVSGNGSGCNQVHGRFVVDQVELDPAGVPVVFAARFEQFCEAWPMSLYGAISLNATAPFRTFSITHGPLDFGNQNLGSSVTKPVTISNDGPSSLTVSTGPLTGTGASQFTVGANTCANTTLTAGQSCSMSVTFHPTGATGQRNASFLIYDDLAPPGSNGRDYPVTGFAVDPPPPIDATGEYTPLTPARLLDTRDGTGQGGFPAVLGPSQTRDLQITGRGNVPATGVSAVVLNVTITGPNIASYLTVWPSGTSRPDVSNLNFVDRQVVANMVTVKIGANGKVSLFNFSGWTHVVADVVGFYSTSTGPQGSRYQALTPQRTLDTRDGTGRGGVVGKVGPGGVVPLNVVGVGGVFPGATTVVLNVTVSDATLPSYLSVYPSDVARPETSTMNMVAGSLVSNLVIVRVPANGIVNLFNFAGATNVVADVMGYYDTNRTTERGRFHPVTPTRVIDTRTFAGRLRPQTYGAANMSNWPESPVGDPTAVVLNVTADHPSADGFLTAFPMDVDQIPWSSNVNFRAGTVVPNQVMTRVSAYPRYGYPTGTYGIYNGIGNTDVLIDAFGYFT